MVLAKKERLKKQKHCWSNYSKKKNIDDPVFEKKKYILKC